MKKVPRVRREMATYTPDEIRRVLRAADKDRSGHLWYLALSGLRLGEIAGLRWSDIDFGAGAWHWATATAPIWPTTCSSPCARWPTSSTACVKASAGTYAMLENKLAWAPGSIDTILAGGEPNETVVKQRRATHNPLAHTATEAPSRASSEELLLELLCLAGRQPYPHRQLQRALRSDSGVNGEFRRGERGTYPIAGVLEQPALVRLDRGAQHLVVREQGRTVPPRRAARPRIGRARMARHTPVRHPTAWFPAIEIGPHGLSRPCHRGHQKEVAAQRLHAKCSPHAEDRPSAGRNVAVPRRDRKSQPLGERLLRHAHPTVCYRAHGLVKNYAMWVTITLRTDAASEQGPTPDRY